MPATLDTAPLNFIERRQSGTANNMVECERRQFFSSYENLSPEAAELATAIDNYKMQHRRRFINFEEMLSVFKSLGYHK